MLILSNISWACSSELALAVIVTSTFTSFLSHVLIFISPNLFSMLILSVLLTVYDLLYVFFFSPSGSLPANTLLDRDKRPITAMKLYTFRIARIGITF